LYAGEAYVTVSGQQHKAMVSQLTTASKERIRDFFGVVSVADLQRVEQAIRVQLAL
jgi:mRNA-degrading endonuclease toxin of MazEF toxin-antitoxin module